MYTKNNIFGTYLKNLHEKDFSSDIPDITKKRTLELINVAINCCEDWNTAVDVGGGNGHYSLSLTDKFKNIFLIEPTLHEEHERIQKKHQNYTVIHKLVEETELDSKVDFIMLCDLFEHILHIEEFAQKISDLQDKGGVVYILTPNPLFCGPAIQSEIHNSKIGIYGHERHYFPHEILNIMNPLGYTLIYKAYEELPLRDTVRRVLRGISRRHKKYSMHYLYRKFVGPIFALIFRILSPVIQGLVYQSEYRNRDNQEHAKSVVYIFKKQ
ncbi:MAG: class I SAM-dependent methyltransferase [Candidatus Taylorbacteria bacterium]|nr:class I SAM-dependent methyltransferase [Candidatus Taylorbacteria bacterium]